MHQAGLRGTSQPRSSMHARKRKRSEALGDPNFQPKRLWEPIKLGCAVENAILCCVTLIRVESKFSKFRFERSETSYVIA
jgi:hypothetical protein